MGSRWADSGERGCVRLRRIQPDLPVLMLSQYVQRSYAAVLAYLRD
ncbi:hypothetical protein OG389_24485 [Streptomyces sp. NBC_00435]